LYFKHDARECHRNLNRPGLAGGWFWFAGGHKLSFQNRRDSITCFPSSIASTSAMRLPDER
jgi:hypothetical protein